MAYDPPTLEALRASVARDLRDQGSAAFSTEELNDYINAAIAELNEVRPIEQILSITDLAGLNALGLDYVWQVESVDTQGVGQSIIPPNNDESNYPNGWQFYAGSLILPRAMTPWLSQSFDDAALQINVYGYRSRDPLILDTDIAEFALDIEEQAVRQFAAWRGLEALEGDRQLFQQWQTAANNSDVSPTQLSNMEQAAESEWNRTRRRLYTVRHPVVGW